MSNLVETKIPDAWVIVGVGYSGQRLARELRSQGAEVTATTRAPTDDALKPLREAGVTLVEADFLAPGPLPRLDVGRGATAVISVPPARGGSELDQVMERRIIRWLADHGVTRVIYWSATSVYGSSEGGQVIDSTPEEPNTSVGIRRYAAERRTLSEAARVGVDVDIMRLVGIYGPQRTIRRRLLANDYRLVEGGHTYSNRIHVDDIVSATLHIASRPFSDSRWVVSDAHPFVIREMVSWACERLGLELPPEVPLDSLTERAQSFWKGNRRAHPLRLLAGGWRPTYPTFKEGLTASWAEEDAES